MADETTNQPIGLESAFSDGLSMENLVEIGDQALVWVSDVLLTRNSLMEVAIILIAFSISWFTQGWCGRFISTAHKYALQKVDEDEIRSFVLPVMFAFVALIMVLLASFVFAQLSIAVSLIPIASSLLAAWVVIRLASNLIGEPFWARTVATLAWGLAALNIFGLLAPTITLLDAFAVNVGATRVSVLLVIQAIALVVILLWLAAFLSRLLQSRINTLPSLTPSVQILIGKVSRIALIALALFVALTSLGIDLSIFAVLGGAIGIGVGFGLQKIVGNFVSGLILLMDRSIKPGDVIEVAGTYGWVKSLGARYTSVVTRDGYEHLIPNEEFIVSTVTNWSFSDRLVRVRKPIGIAYNSDVRLAIRLVVEAAESVDRVLRDPEVKCQLKGFGDNSIELEVRFWLRDPESGVSNVSSEVLLGVWDRFKAHGIEIPYPQRDIHIKEMPQTAPPVAESASD
jgi:small-conductance mechanosensitive channel